MAIKKYTPPTWQIIDNRNPNGGFYEATCDSCGTIYYPKRITSKYCTPKCSLDHFRKSKAEKLALGGIIESKPKVNTHESLVIQAKMKLKKAKEEYDNHISICKASSNADWELKEAERLEEKIKKLEIEYSNLLRKKQVEKVGKIIVHKEDMCNVL